MKLFKNIFAALLLLGLTAGCESDIEIELDAFEDQIIVEGYMESGETARVFLTRNIGFFDPIGVELIEDVVVDDAIVVITDGDLRDTCTLVFAQNYLPPYFYQGESIIAKENHRYGLEIYVGTKTLTATTYVPEAIPLDSLWWYADELHYNEIDSVGPIRYQYTDPDTLGNYYRLYYRRLQTDPIPYSTSGPVRSDRIVNGLTYESDIYRGRTLAERYLTTPGEEIADKFRFYSGQIVEIRWNAISRHTYEFWQSLRDNEAADAFGSSQNLSSNIDGGIGIWGGYGVSIDTVYIP
jgi:hypothetical protein